MKPGHGDVLLAEGDPEVAEDEERLVEEFRRQLDLGMWAAVPDRGAAGRREAVDGARLRRGPARRRAGRSSSRRPRAAERSTLGSDLARRRGERARELLRAVRSASRATSQRLRASFGFLSVRRRRRSRGGYGYLVYPHRPLVAYDTATGELLSEYCVGFPTDERRRGCPTPTTCSPSGWRCTATSAS